MTAKEKIPVVMQPETDFTRVPLIADVLFWPLGRTGGANKVAIFKLDAIGDFVIWAPYARFVREAYPDSEIVLIVNHKHADLASKVPAWDRIIPLDVERLRTEFLYRFATMRRLRREKFGISLHPTFSRDIFIDLLVRATGSKVRISHTGDTSNQAPSHKSRSDHWYSGLVPNRGALRSEIEHAADFSTYICNREICVQTPSLPLMGAVPTRLEAIQYFVVFPGASVGFRRWPIDRFARVAQWLKVRTGWTPVIAGGSGESELADQLRGLIGIDAVDISGATSLPDLVATLRSANFVISNETSASHIAAAVQTPCVTVLGGGHFGRFLPYPVISDARLSITAQVFMDCFGCNWKCPYLLDMNGIVPCIEAVTIDSVMEHIEWTLALVENNIHVVP